MRWESEYAEANKYLGVTHDNSNNLQSRVAPTEYAIAQGVYTSNSHQTEDGKAAGEWWLRSHGGHQSRAAYVIVAGSLSSSLVSVNGRAVRPAFWLNLESDIF